MSDRKYRHRGYQDDDGPRDRRPREIRDSGAPGRIEGAPRGRGVGLPAQVVFKCARCGAPVQEAAVARDATCRACGAALHSCTNCSFFDTGARFECRKALEHRIESKMKANECQYFEPKTVRDLRSSASGTPSDPRAAFDALFKK